MKLYFQIKWLLEKWFLCSISFLTSLLSHLLSHFLFFHFLFQNKPLCKNHVTSIMTWPCICKSFRNFQWVKSQIQDRSNPSGSNTFILLKYMYTEGSAPRKSSSLNIHYQKLSSHKVVPRVTSSLNYMNFTW